MTRSVVVPLAVSLMMIASVSGLPEEVFGDLDKELKSCPKEYPKCKYTGQCCPKNFVCGPNACCDPGTVTCPHNTCCDAGYHCCPQSGSWSGCCPNGLLLFSLANTLSSRLHRIGHARLHGALSRGRGRGHGDGGTGGGGDSGDSVRNGEHLIPKQPVLVQHHAPPRDVRHVRSCLAGS